MNTLVIGSTGMIGSHFARATREKGWPTFGLARSSATSRLEGRPEPDTFRCDILDRDALDGVFRKVKPDLVIHMAAQAFNGISWEFEESTLRANVTGTANVMRAVRLHAPHAKVLLACSSAEYGNVPPEECPLKEERFLRPVSPYGVSKVATEAIGYQHYSNHSIPVYLPRLFIHVGTGHPPATAIQNFARQLARIARGKADPVLKVGYLGTARDFIDVRDGVEGMMLLLEKGTPGEAMNICTGKAYGIGEILSMLVRISGLKVDVTEDPALLRPSDEPLLLGDNSKLRALGWSRRHTMEQTLEAVYEDWLGRV